MLVRRMVWVIPYLRNSRLGENGHGEHRVATVGLQYPQLDGRKQKSPVDRGF